MSSENSMWIFNGDNSRFPSGVFSSIEQGVKFIKKYKLSGILTEYPVDIGCYDWEVKEGYFVPKKPEHFTSEFIGKFSPGYTRHFHFKEGLCRELEGS